MRRFLRAICPPALCLGLGVAALAFLLEGDQALDLRLPFLFWLGSLPLSGGWGGGWVYPLCYGGAALLNGGFWLLLLGLVLLCYGVILPWQSLAVLALADLLFSYVGAWLGAGFSLAQAELRRGEEEQ